jgi:MoaA/NifB/PqqE/SkfB family radical SAM enzyme
MDGNLTPRRLAWLARRAVRRASRVGRAARQVARALSHPYHPILVHVIPVRRCNLACAYCNEYDAVSAPVATSLLTERLDRLVGLGTSMITFSGGEPLLHPELEALVAHTRRRGMIASLITNGYLLSRERIRGLNAAGLDYLQISIDNVEPDAVSMKSLRLLEPKLRWLAELAAFGVNINSVVGSAIRQPEDALVIARRARELGFTSSIGILHDGRGQLDGLDARQLAVYQELKSLGSRGTSKVNAWFQDNLAAGRANEWSCRAGARYLYVDEDGIVSYCSQMRGIPGIPLAEYSEAEIRREYGSKKSCAPYCTINCVQRVAVFDNWRAPQKTWASLRPEPRRLPDEQALAR